MSSPSSSPLDWPSLEAAVAAGAPPEADPATSLASSSRASVRLFDGTPADAARVVLYRDNHCWCPYCQKVWLWLETRRVPYTVRRVTMRCYLGAGQVKETWFTSMVPSGMLPALSLDGALITESDVILQRLEAAFGPLSPGEGLDAPAVLPLRLLERALFRAWCGWLCYPSSGPADEAARRAEFVAVAARVAAALSSTPGPFFLGGHFSTADCVFVPYVERMAASLYYYKGYNLRAELPAIGAWLAALETLPAYAGTQSDAHTHAHDLPPQMGGCFASGDAAQRAAAAHVDSGPFDTVPDAADAPAPPAAALEAVRRCAKFRRQLEGVNPDRAPGRLDAALRCALTALATGRAPPRPPPGAAAGLRYIRDRVSVPRDMSLHAARRLRAALEETAALDAPAGPATATASVPVEHRRDQDPRPFRGA